MSNTTTNEKPTRRSEIAVLNRSSETQIESVLISALQASLEKANQVDCQGDDRAYNPVAYGTALEVERRLKAFKTPATIKLVKGIIKPVDGLEQELAETPLIKAGEVEMPEWATSEASHCWVEVDFAGSQDRYLLDPASPPQFTGRPVETPKAIYTGGVGNHPPQYVEKTNASKTLSAPSVDPGLKPPWEENAQTWPFGFPAPLSQRPTDGGTTEIKTNSIINIDARDGLAKLPSNSVDCVITSPPYRLQREYEGAEAIWGGSSQCDHNWVCEEIYTDTPIRSEGGAGFSSTDNPEELRKERWRESKSCPHCGAWKGQLGLEPELDQFINNLISVFDQIKRVLANDGSLYLNVADSYSDGHRNDNGDYRDAPKKSLAGFPPKLEMAMRESGWIVRERLVWVKPNPTPDPAHDRRTPAWEYVYRFVLDQKYTDHNSKGKKDVLEIGTSTSDTEHTAPMPEQLPTELLESTLPPGEEATVLDPFAGSGTVLESAAKLGHDYIGFEIDEQSVKKAANRLDRFKREAESLSGQTSLTSY